MSREVRLGSDYASCRLPSETHIYIIVISGRKNQLNRCIRAPADDHHGGVFILHRVDRVEIYSTVR